jgi:TPP-dependent trihydroxycyclohexane-1,2-dione (THcHDO) dehydratase
VIVCRTEPYRPLLDSGAFWDLGVPEVAEDPRVAARSAEHAAAARVQRPYLAR